MLVSYRTRKFPNLATLLGIITHTQRVYHRNISMVFFYGIPSHNPTCLFTRFVLFSQCCKQIRSKSSLPGAIKQMEQPGQIVPLHNEGDVMKKQPVSDNSFVVVDQEPSGKDVIPDPRKSKSVLFLSVFKCVFGSLLLLVEICNLAVVKFNATIFFGIWYGLTVSTHVLVRSRIVKPSFYIKYC